MRDVLLPDETSSEADFSLPCECLEAMPTRSTTFFGRSDDLKLIDEVFFPNELPQTQGELNERTVATYCLTGTGGVGKTHLAAEFVLTRKGRFEVVCWVNAASRTKLLNGYAEFAAKIGLISSTHRPEDSILLDYVNGWLNRPVRNRSQAEGPFVRWLLVIDNVDKSDEMMPEDWPYEGRGCVLIVGRDPSNRKNSRFGLNGHELGPLPDAAAVTMLLQITDKSSEPSAALSAQRIIEVWGRFPLSLMCVAGVIDREGLSLSRCAAYGTEKRDNLLSSTWRYAANQYNLASIWALSELSPPALALLEMITLMDTEGIPIQLFNQPVLLGANAILSSETIEASRRSLWRLGLIGMDVATDSITVHAVVQQTVIAQLRASSERFATTYQATVSLISGYWPNVLMEEVNFSTRNTLSQEEKCEELVSHTERLIHIYQEHDETSRSNLASYSFLRLCLEYAW